MPAIPPLGTARIEAPIDCDYEIERARADKGKRERPSDYDSARQCAQFAQYAAKLVRSARVTLNGRDEKVTTH